MKIKAFAKVNLILKVIGKLDNGYHNLQMLNGKINLYDEITINKNNINKDILIFKNSKLDGYKDNLVLKCISVLKDMYNIKDTFDIIIYKNIPVGAGLGGGSVDAASIILALLDMYNIDYRKEDLAKKFVSFGADIPYAFYNDIKLVEGIGDIIKDVNIFFDKEFILINPNIEISTKEVFVNNKIFTEPLEINQLEEQIKKDGEKIFVNDLENAAYSVNASIKELKNNLLKYGKLVMSGSGSTHLLYANDIDNVLIELKNIYPTYLIKKVKLIKE